MERRTALICNSWPALLTATVLAAAATLTGSCSNPGKPALSPPVTSTTEHPQKGGQVVAKQPSAEDLRRLEFLEAAAKDVDTQFPVPDTALGIPLFRVSSVNPDATLALQSGPVIKMDGVRCSAEGIRTIAQMFASDNDLRVGWVRSTTDDSTPIPVEVWLIEGEPNSRSYSRLQEMAITSGWCKPDDSGPSKRHDRYLALMKVRAEYIARFGPETPACTQAGAPKLSPCAR